MPRSRFAYRLPALLFVLLAAWTAPLLARAAATVGEPAPAFSAVDADGETITLAALRGRVVVLEWTNDGCPFVRKHYDSGNMQALQKQFTERGVVWLSVISSAPGEQGHVDGATANRLSRERGASPSHVLLDETGVVGRLYGARTTPQMAVIDARGVLVYAGGIDDLPTGDPDDVPRARPLLKLAVEEVLAGKPVSKPVSRPYGCSIKYG